MDVLSDVLRTITLSQVVYNQKHLPRPWGVRVDLDATYVVHMVVAGECWLSAAALEQPLRLVSGDVVLVAGSPPHSLQDRLDSRVEELPDLIARLTRLRSVASHASSHLICAGYFLQPHPMLAGLPPVLRLSVQAGRSRGLLASIVERITDEGVPPTRPRDPGSQVLIDQLSSVLLTEFVRAHYAHEDLAPAEHSFRAALRDRHLGAVLAAVHDAPHAPWTLTRMARVAGMSRSVFAERFRRQVGESPAYYLTRWRMQRAAELLRREALSIQEVMSHVGYGSEATFSRAFKRCLGTSPGSYRRTVRGQEPTRNSDAAERIQAIPS